MRAGTPGRRVARLTRVTTGRCEGHAGCYFTTEDLPTGGNRRNKTTFLLAEQMPEFEGARAWLEVERVPAVPWAYWNALRQVEPPAV